MMIDVRTFGAAGDGAGNDTRAIQNAIDACHASGGGRVSLHNGTFRSGTLYLKSNVYLQIEAGAVLLASGDISDYPDDTHYNRYVNEKDMDRCFIYAEDAENTGLAGFGEINGNAEAFPNPGSIYRPMMIRFLRCRNIRVENLRLYNAAAWTSAFLDSVNIWCLNLEIRNDKRYNGDGLDFDGCANVFVDNCKILGTDDNLCLQSSSRDYPVRNVQISNCLFSSICAGIRIGLKSVGEISDVTISNCAFENIWREGLKIECTEGGTIRNITASNLVMRNVSRPVFILLNNRLSDIGSSIGLTEMPEIGRLENILISNVIISDTDEMKNIHYRFKDDIMGSPAFHGIRVDAEAAHKIDGLILRDLIYHAIGTVKQAEIPAEYPQVLDLKKHPGSVTSENYYPDWSRAACMDIRNVDSLILDNICLKLINPDERPPFIIDNCDVLKQNIFVKASF